MPIEKVKKEFYASGAKRRTVTYQDDIQQGPVTEYYESGAVKKKLEYIEGRPEGIAMEYYDTGELWVEEVYRDGKLNGIVKSFYKTGAIQSELSYVDGKLSGFCKVYYGSGILKKVAKFEGGKQVGEAKIFQEDGTLKRKGDFFDENDSRDEIVYEKGSKEEKVSGSKLFIQFLVLMGLVGAVSFIFSEDSPFFKGKDKGQIQSDLRKVAGKEDTLSWMAPPANPADGITRTYYPSGKVYGEWSYEAGKQHGVTKLYHENGKLKSEIGYKNGRLDGRSIIYTETGRIISNNVYRDNYLIKENAAGGLQGQRQGKRIMVPQQNSDYDDSVFSDPEDAESEEEKEEEQVLEASSDAVS